MKEILMGKIAKKIITLQLKMQEGENLCIVTEPEKLSIANAIATQAYSLSIEPTIVIMIPRHTDSQEPNPLVACAMKASDAFISIVSKSITHTNAVKDALACGSRGLVLTQFSEDMMIHGGMEADFKAIKPICCSVAEALANSKRIHLTTPYGTDLSFSAEGRRGNALYGLVEAGQFSTAPTIEANVSPIEGTAKGIIVADASVPYLGIGLLTSPIKLTVENGFIIHIFGGKEAQILKQDLSSKNDPNVYNIAELGIGLNPQCRFSGFMLEDEGVYGSCHIGIGTSINLGGQLKAACHYDVIMTEPTIIADDITIMKDGKLTDQFHPEIFESQNLSISLLPL